MYCHTQTCCEWNGSDPPKPSKATVWVAQATTINDIRLVPVCDAHADGWYDGSDWWLPKIKEPITEHDPKRTAQLWYQDAKP